MKQIGPNLWTGDPWLEQFAPDIERWTAEAKKTTEHHLRKQSPADRFMFLANQRFSRPMVLSAVDPKWFQANEYCFVRLEKIYPIGEDSLSITRRWQDLIFMDKLYVFDTRQGEGWGSKCLQDLTEISEQSGAGIFLYASSFGFSKDGDDVNGIQTVDEFVEAIVGKWEVLEWRKAFTQAISQFYERAGFVHWNGEIEDGPDRVFDEDTNRWHRPYDLVYVPSTMRREAKDHLMDRLNSGLTSFCCPTNPLIAA